MTGRDTDRTGTTGRLVALAERLAAEGYMNLNKLLEAAVYADGRRAGWRYQPPITPESMEDELDSALVRLDRNEVPSDLIAALEAGLRLLSSGRRADLPIEQAPDPHVCRTCGHVALGAAPQACPDCGAWAGRFRQFVAIYNNDNTDPANPADVLALLAQNAADLKHLVAGLNEEQMTARPPGVDWSIRDHIAHFCDTQDLLDARTDLMLQYDDPELTPIAVFEFATDRARRPKSGPTILAEFDDARTRCVSRLESLPLKSLWRTGRHPEFGRITILRQALYVAAHEQAHFPDIQSVRDTILKAGS